MTGTEGSARAGGIGARLRAGRERSGLTVVAAAEKLHLDPKMIEALESDRFEDLGAAVYVRGHIRRYAELVHEPADGLLELFALIARRLAPPDLKQVPRAVTGTEPPGGLLVPGLVVIVAVALIGGVWWLSHGLAQVGAKLAPVQAQPLVAPEAAVPAAASAPPAALPAAAQAPAVRTAQAGAKSVSRAAVAAATGATPGRDRAAARNRAVSTTPAAGAAAEPGAGSPTSP